MNSLQHVCKLRGQFIMFSHFTHIVSYACDECKLIVPAVWKWMESRVTNDC